MSPILPSPFGLALAHPPRSSRLAPCQELTLEHPNIVNPRKNVELKVGAGVLGAECWVLGPLNAGGLEGVVQWLARPGCRGLGLRPPTPPLSPTPPARSTRAASRSSLR